jgi:DNA-binding transcriptional LysR family regulator
MNQDHLAGLDLNLLRVFEALVEERSVTRAARRLGVTQSAVSHALSRLRYALGDELFVRTPQGMRATPRASEIATPILSGLRQLQAAFSPAPFDPAATTRRFTLEAGPYACAVLLPEVVLRLRRAAPGAELRVRNFGERLADGLDFGRVDAAVAAFARIPPRLGHEPLFEERMVWVMRRGHPLSEGMLTLERLAELSPVVIALPEEEGGENGLERRSNWEDPGLRDALAAAGRPRPVALTVPDAQTALAVVIGSDMAAFVPRRLAQALGRASVALHDPPGGAPANQVGLVWRRDRDSAALSWFRALLIDSGRALQAPEEAARGSAAQTD